VDITAIPQIDSDIYNRMSDIWWNEKGFAAMGLPLPGSTLPRSRSKSYGRMRRKAA